MTIAPGIIGSLRAKSQALLPHLDERAQRLTLAAEARSLGHGGIVSVARASGSSRSRVQQGVAELESGEEPTGRIRRPGAGRKPITETDPGIVDALLGLVEPTRRGTRSPRCAGRRCRPASSRRSCRLLVIRSVR